jgi:hypothetical protein
MQRGHILDDMGLRRRTPKLEQRRSSIIHIIVVILISIATYVVWNVPHFMSSKIELDNLDGLVHDSAMELINFHNTEMQQYNNITSSHWRLKIVLNLVVLQREYITPEDQLRYHDARCDVCLATNSLVLYPYYYIRDVATNKNSSNIVLDYRIRDVIRNSRKIFMSRCRIENRIIVHWCGWLDVYRLNCTNMATYEYREWHKCICCGSNTAKTCDPHSTIVPSYHYLH